MADRAPTDADDQTPANADDRVPADADGQTPADADDRAPANADDHVLASADDPLLVWALASFHTGLLVALLVAVVYLAGPLGDLLAGLQTVVGLALYLGLWASTWWTNRRWLRAVNDSETDASVVLTGGKWGGVDGVCFFWLLVVVNVVPILGPETVANLEIDVALFFLVAVGIGTVLALGIGGIGGSLFAILDVGLARAAARIVPESSE